MPSLSVSAQEEDEDDTICALPIDRGLCRAYSPKWAMNAATGECVRFLYGGCGGNGNRFDSRGDCESACKFWRKIWSRSTWGNIFNSTYVCLTVYEFWLLTCGVIHDVSLCLWWLLAKNSIIAMSTNPDSSGLPLTTLVFWDSNPQWLFTHEAYICTTQTHERSWLSGRLEQALSEQDSIINVLCTHTHTCTQTVPFVA